MGVRLCLKVRTSLAENLGSAPRTCVRHHRYFIICELDGGRGQTPLPSVHIPTRRPSHKHITEKNEVNNTVVEICFNKNTVKDNI